MARAHQEARAQLVPRPSSFYLFIYYPVPLTPSLSGRVSLTSSLSGPVPLTSSLSGPVPLTSSLSGLIPLTFSLSGHNLQYQWSSASSLVSQTLARALISPRPCPVWPKASPHNLQAILAFELPPCTPRRTDTLNMTESKEWSSDLQRLLKFRDKIPPLHSKAFTGDINTSSLPAMTREFQVQLQARNLLELTEYPGTDLPAPVAHDGVDLPPAPPQRVGAEPVDHRVRRLAAFIGAQFVILLSMVSGAAREFAYDLFTLPSFSNDPTQDTIINQLRAKFLPANYSMLIQRKITSFTAPPTMRPSSILDALRHLNRQLEGDAAFTDGQLRTLFIQILDDKLQQALVLVKVMDLDAYAAEADSVFDQPMFLASLRTVSVNAIQSHANQTASVNAIQNHYGNHQSQIRSSRDQGRSNPFQQRSSGPSSPGRSASPGRAHDNGVCYNCWQDTWMKGEMDHTSRNCPNPTAPRPDTIWPDTYRARQNALAELATSKRRASSSSSSGSDSHRQRVGSPATVTFQTNPETTTASRLAALEMHLGLNSDTTPTLNEPSAPAH